MKKVSPVTKKPMLKIRGDFLKLFNLVSIRRASKTCLLAKIFFVQILKRSSSKAVWSTAEFTKFQHSKIAFTFFFNKKNIFCCEFFPSIKIIISISMFFQLKEHFLCHKKHEKQKKHKKLYLAWRNNKLLGKTIIRVLMFQLHFIGMTCSELIIWNLTYICSQVKWQIMPGRYLTALLTKCFLIDVKKFPIIWIE